MDDVKCHVCGKKDCESKADPVGGPFALHNRRAYSLLLKRRAEQEHHDVTPCYDMKCTFKHPHGGPFEHE